MGRKVDKPSVVMRSAILENEIAEAHRLAYIPDPAPNSQADNPAVATIDDKGNILRTDLPSLADTSGTPVLSVGASVADTSDTSTPVVISAVETLGTLLRCVPAFRAKP